MHITVLIQGYVCTENYSKERERERAREEEKGRGKVSSLRLNFILDTANNSASF